MHPTTARAFLNDSVAEVDERLASVDLGVTDVKLDLDAPELVVAFDHVEYETEAVNARSGLLGPGGQILQRQERVLILGRPPRREHLHLRMDLALFDLVPPTAELLDETGEPLPAEQWPVSWSGQGIVQQHPVYRRPFFCRPGLREYHEHQQHEDEPWARWRDVLPLHKIVIEVLGDMHSRFHGAA